MHKLMKLLQSLIKWNDAEKRSGNDIKNTIFVYKLGKVYRLVDDVRNPIRKFAKFLIFCLLLRIEEKVRGT